MNNRRKFLRGLGAAIAGVAFFGHQIKAMADENATIKRIAGRAPGDIYVYLDGKLQNKNEHYTIKGDIITFKDMLSDPWKFR